MPSRKRRRGLRRPWDSGGGRPSCPCALPRSTSSSSALAAAAATARCWGSRRSREAISGAAATWINMYRQRAARLGRRPGREADVGSQGLGRDKDAGRRRDEIKRQRQWARQALHDRFRIVTARCAAPSEYAVMCCGEQCVENRVRSGPPQATLACDRGAACLSAFTSSGI
jgi:hypothetical protein